MSGKGKRRRRSEPPLYLTEEERGALMAVIKKPRDRAIFHLAMDQGLSTSEPGLIQLSDWNQRTNRIKLRSLRTPDLS